MDQALSQGGAAPSKTVILSRNAHLTEAMMGHQAEVGFEGGIFGIVDQRQVLFVVR